MNKSRRIGTMVAMATAAVGMATASTAAPAAASSYYRGPAPVSSWLHAVKANTDSWVSIYWRTGKKVCDVEVRVRTNDGDIDYPGGRRYTSFNRGDTLRPGRTDFTAVRVEPDLRRSGIARLRATIAFNDCGHHARTLKKTFSLALPVVRGSYPGHGNDHGDNDGHGNGHGNNDDHGNGHGDNDGTYGGTPAPASTTPAAPAPTTTGKY